MIIAIAGVKRSGKDTAAQYLIDNWWHVPPEDPKSLFHPETFALPFQMHHFADPLKRALEGIYGWDKGIWDLPEKEEIDPFWGISPRQAAQMLGTEWSIMLSEKFPEYARVTGRKTYLKAFQRFIEEHRGRIDDLYLISPVDLKDSCLLHLSPPFHPSTYVISICLSDNKAAPSGGSLV